VSQVLVGELQRHAHGYAAAERRAKGKETVGIAVQALGVAVALPGGQFSALCTVPGETYPLIGVEDVVQLGGHGMFGRETEVDLGHDDAGVVRDEATHAILEGRGPCPAIDMTAAMRKNADWQNGTAVIRVGRRVDADGDSRVGCFLVCAENQQYRMSGGAGWLTVADAIGAEWGIQGLQLL